MKLVSVKIENFKCIEDSDEFSIVPITCLVGKNESGKTAILQALHKLNPDTPELKNFDALQEYPRRRYSDYKQRQTQNPDNVLTTQWDLENSDIDAISSIIGKGSLKAPRITIKKGYDNLLKWSIDINESKVVKYFLTSSGINLTEFSELVASETIEILLEQINIAQNEANKRMEEDAENQDIETQSKIKILDTLKSSLNSTFNPKSPTPTQLVIDILSQRLPKLLYFADYQRMPGQVSIDALNEKLNNNTLNQGDRIFLALLDLAGSSTTEIVKMGKYEALKAELEAVSARLSEEIFEYWTQNRHLDVRFEFDNARPEDPAPFNAGYVFRTRIWNNRYKVSVSFDERSTGFVWFFSFLVWFSQVRKNYGDNLIILLDEPALNLHAKAQSDLLRYVEERLLPQHQVIYTTHSPFMIDPNNILAARTVEDKGTDKVFEGTKVGDRVFSTDKDTIFPLQRVLGYEIAQTLFIGKNSLLVEGPSDLLYLQWFSKELQKINRTGLDPRWAITPCRGIDRMESFAKLFGSNMIHISALVDYADGVKSKIRRFSESDYIKKGCIISINQFTGTPEADIEDLIGREFYINLVNRCYGLVGKNAISEKKSDAAGSRVITEVENHMKKIGIDFDHYGPAEYLTEHSTEFTDEIDRFNTTMDNFEKVFADLNSHLEE
jgi:predicted ATP-dependent endonuclease of OLD family